MDHEADFRLDRAAREDAHAARNVALLLAERLENAGERLLSDRLVDDDPDGAARAVLNDQDDRANAMGFFSRDIQTLDDLFVQTLRDSYYAEQKIVQALPAMIEYSTNPRLRSALEHHLAETKQQVQRLEKVFEMHGSQPKTVDCPAIDGIIKEAKEIMGDVKLEDKEVLDAAMIAAAQAVEHCKVRIAHRLGPGPWPR